MARNGTVYPTVRISGTSALFISQTRRRRDKLDNTSVTCVCMCIGVDSLTAISTHVRNVCYAKHTFLARLCSFL